MSEQIPHLGRFLRRARLRTGRSLRDVADVVSARGVSLEHTKLSRIEKGKNQPSVHVLRALAEFYGLTEAQIAHRVDLEIARAPEWPQDITEAYDRGIEHWKRGEIDAAIACTAFLQHATPTTDVERDLLARSRVDFAAYARDLGRIEFAQSLLEEAFRSGLRSELEFRVLLLLSSVYRSLGLMPLAWATAHEAARRAPRDDKLSLAWVVQQMAKLHQESGELGEALKLVRRSIRLLRAAGEPYHESRGRMLLVRTLEDAGRYKAAIREADRAIALCEEHDLKRIAVFLRVFRGSAMVRAGQAEAAVTLLRRAVAEAVLLEDSNAEFHAHHAAWKAYLALGDEEAAEIELAVARRLAGAITDRGPEAREVLEGRPAEGRQHRMRRPGVAQPDR